MAHAARRDRREHGSVSADANSDRFDAQITIPPQHGAAVVIRRGARLRVISPEGGQVSDLVAYRLNDPTTWLSTGRTIDYNGTIYVSEGAVIYSNRSTPMLKIVEDTAGRHDLLLAPCSQEMFEQLHGVDGPHPSCFGNLASVLEPFGVPSWSIPTAFNVFMSVTPNPVTGEIRIDPPSCGPGDYMELEAMDDLVLGITACSAEQTNAGSFSSIVVWTSSST